MALTPKMVTIDRADPRRLATFWTEAAEDRVESGHGGFRVLVPEGNEFCVAG